MATEIRWALTFKIDGEPFLCGKYCFSNYTSEEPQIRTFRTRREARNAKPICCYRDANAIKVRMEVLKTG